MLPNSPAGCNDSGANVNHGFRIGGSDTSSTLDVSHDGEDLNPDIDGDHLRSRCRYPSSTTVETTGADHHAIEIRRSSGVESRMSTTATICVGAPDSDVEYDDDGAHGDDFDARSTKSGKNGSIVCDEGISSSRRQQNRGDLPRNATSISIQLDRSPYTQDELFTSFDYHGKESTGVMQATKSAVKSSVACCAHFSPKQMMMDRFPILKWLLHYDVKKDLMADVIAGVTVAVMHIPQGMAYSLLAGMPAVNGLYMALFPVLVYLIFCHSRHNSMGTFAVVMLMTGTLANQILDKHGRYSEETKTGYTPVQVATVIAFAVGMWQVIMSIFRLGTLSVLLSDVLISGFTTGAAVHVLTSQLPGLFGLPLAEPQEFPRIFRMHFNVFTNLFRSNVVAVIVSTVTVAAMAINNDVIKPRLAKRCPVPVPIELIAVVTGTFISYYMDLHKIYNLPIIKTVPTGVPFPNLPPFGILQDALLGSIVIAAVAYTTSYSLERMFAKQHNYESSPNQELFAQGMANLVGSFFRCAPVAASMSRSLVQQTVGGATQLSNIVSCAILVIILLFMGPLVEPLPKCILSAVIVVSLKGMFLQFSDLGVAWKSSKLDAFIWLATFCSVVVIDIDYGLAIGVAVSLITLLWRNQRAYACTLGEIPNTGIYVDVQRFSAAEEIHNVKIFHYGAGIHFANRDYFREVLFNLTGLDPVKWHEQAMKRLKKQRQAMNKAIKHAAAAAAIEEIGKKNEKKRGLFWTCLKHHDLEEDTDAEKSSRDLNKVQGNPEDNSTEIRDITIDMTALTGGGAPTDHLALPTSTGLRLRRRSIHVDTTGNPLPFRYLLIDLSGVSFVDMAGVKLLKSLVLDYERINIQMIFAGPTEPVLHMFRKMKFTDDVSPEYFFPTVNDAVVCSKWKIIGFKCMKEAQALPCVPEKEEEQGKKTKS